MADDSIHPTRTGYPRTFEEFESWFASELTCYEYISRLRWPQGFQCPHCGARDSPWLKKSGLFQCPQCRAQTSITSGTLFHNTHKPLRTWFLAMWFVTSQKQGASALGLQRVLGLGSYHTAWGWLHKLRRAMVRPERDRLNGVVEVDETYVGGRGIGGRGRGAERKALVAIAAEVRGRGPGRIRMAQIPDASAISLRTFVQANVCEGAEIHTDGWSGYNGLDSVGYTHVVTNISASGDPAHVVMPRVHLVASLLDRWWLGTHQGAIRSAHLDYYLDEFTFRFNRRTSRARGLLFYRLMQHAVTSDPVPYRTIVGGKPQTANKM